VPLLRRHPVVQRRRRRRRLHHRAIGISRLESMMIGSESSGSGSRRERFCSRFIYIQRAVHSSQDTWPLTMERECFPFMARSDSQPSDHASHGRRGYTCYPKLVYNFIIFFQMVIISSLLSLIFSYEINGLILSFPSVNDTANDPMLFFSSTNVVEILFSFSARGCYPICKLRGRK
jgi:hypothetical protein